MGTSKIIMLSGVYLILGAYNIGFSVADDINFDLAANTANTTQAEQIARSGVALAITKMANNATLHTYPMTRSSLLSGYVDYTASQSGLPLSQSEITSTGYFNGKKVIVKAIMSFDRDRWRLIQLFTIPTT